MIKDAFSACVKKVKRYMEKLFTSDEEIAHAITARDLLKAKQREETYVRHATLTHDVTKPDALDRYYDREVARNNPTVWKKHLDRYPDKAAAVRDPAYQWMSQYTARKRRKLPH